MGVDSYNLPTLPLYAPKQNTQDKDKEMKIVERYEFTHFVQSLGVEGIPFSDIKVSIMLYFKDSRLVAQALYCDGKVNYFIEE